MNNNINRSKFDQEKIKFKYNSGFGAILCPICFYIIKTGDDFNEDESLALNGLKNIIAYRCEQCDLIRRLLIEKINVEIFKRNEY